MGVPRHLQVPLSVDTSISYDLDTSMFPGLDDPRYKHEPVLMIAQDAFPYRHCVTERKHERHQKCVTTKMNSHSSGVSVGYNTAILDDLADIHDVNTDELLRGLKNTEEYISLLNDVIQGLPQSDELQYLDGPTAEYNTMDTNKRFQRDSHRYRSVPRDSCTKTSVPCTILHNNQCDSTIHQCQSRMYSKENNSSQSVTCFKDNYPSQGMRLREHYSVNTCATYSNSVSKLPPPPVHGSQMPDVYTKRKRSEDSFGSSFQKRICYGNDHVASLNQYHGQGFLGTRHGNQIRVM